MRVVLILLIGISLCMLIGRKLFASAQTRILRQFFYLLALAQAVMLFYIVLFAMLQGS